MIENRSLSRIYRINYVDYKFISGIHTDGKQLLIGGFDDEMIVGFFFSPDGNYLEHSFFSVPRKVEGGLSPGQQRLQHNDAIRAAKHRWMAELGFIPGDIQIRHFAFPAWQIGIAEWPLAFFSEVQQALASGTSFGDDFLEEWRQQGRWVMHWKQGYWMNADGEIGDT